MWKSITVIHYVNIIKDETSIDLMNTEKWPSPMPIYNKITRNRKEQRMLKPAKTCFWKTYFDKNQNMLTG